MGTVTLLSDNDVRNASGLPRTYADASTSFPPLSFILSMKYDSSLAMASRPSPKMIEFGTCGRPGFTVTVPEQAVVLHSTPLATSAMAYVPIASVGMRPSNLFPTRVSG